MSCLTGGKRSTKLDWTVEMEESFKTMRQELARGVEPAYPDNSEGSEPVEVVVDASGTGAGAYLAQKQNEEHRVIGFASMTFSPAQQRYSTTERELAALRWAVKTFRPYLYGVKFRLYTDHKPLIYLNNMKIADSRMSRTIEDLSDFNFEIFYKPGKDNTIADLLSRLKHDENDGMDTHTGGSTSPIPSGLTLIPTPGGGDSLFESLYMVLNNEGLDVPNTTDELRKLIIEEMKRNPKEFGLTPGRKTTTMLRLMEQPGQLPLTECIMACSKIYEVQIWVHLGMDNPIIFWPPSLKKDPITRVHLQNLAGVHYNAMVESGKFASTMMEDLDKIVQENLWRRGEPRNDEPLHLKTEDLTLNQNMQSLFATQTSIQTTCTHSTNPVTLPILVHGVPACAILDTGSEICLVNMGLLRKIEDTIGISFNIGQDSNTKVVGMGEKVTPILGTIDLPIALENGKKYTYPVAVMEENQLPCCIILGINILQPMNIKFDFGKKIIYKEENGYKQILKTSNDPSNEEYQCKKCWDVTENKDTQQQAMQCFYIEDKLQWKSWSEKAQIQIENETIQCNGNETTEKVEVDKMENNQSVNSNNQTIEQEDQLENQQRQYEGMLNLPEVKKMQSKDWKIRRLKNLISKEIEIRKWPRWLFNFKTKRKYIILENGILWYNNNKELVPVVNLRWLVDITTAIHEKMAHIGTEKLKDKVIKQLWHPKINKVCQDVAVTCNWCQRNKPKTNEPSPPIIKIQTSKPFELVAVDLLQLPTTRFGNKYVLVATDHYSKWVSAAPLRNKNGSLVAKIMEEKILTSLTAKPEKILSDNGKEFKAREFEQLLISYGIKHIYSTPYKPSSNGAVERVNRTIIQILKGLVNSPTDWDKELPRTLMIYNNTLHAENKKSPSDCLLETAHRVHQSPVVSQDIQKRWKDGNPNFEPFRKGDKVLIKIQKVGDMVQHKLTETFEGPYIIKKVFPNELTYQIATETGQTKKAHYTQLKRFKQSPEYLGKESELIMERKKNHAKTDSEDTNTDDSSLSCEENYNGISRRTYFTDTDTEIEQLRNIYKKEILPKRKKSKRYVEITPKKKKKRFSISLEELQEEFNKTDTHQILNECQSEISSCSCEETIIEKIDDKSSCDFVNVPESDHEPVISEVQDTIANMESVLDTCNEQLGSLNNLCGKDERYNRYSETPKMILSSQVAHLQHMLNTMKKNGAVRDKFMRKGIAELKRASMPDKFGILIDESLIEISHGSSDINSNKSFTTQNRLTRSESEPCEINQDQEPSLEINNRELVSLGDLTFGDPSDTSFVGFPQNSINNIMNQNENNNESSESTIGCVLPPNLYIDRPHTRQRGKAVPIPNIMNRPLEFRKNILEGGNT